MPDTENTRLTAPSLPLGVLLSAGGGFLDAFTYVGHHGVFANAQTGNVVLLGISSATGHWADAVRHVPPLIAFVLGVLTAEALVLPRVARFVRRPMRLALVLEILVLAVLAVVPGGLGDTAVVVLVAYAAAVQATSFRTLRRWSYNSVMTTGNLRTATSAAFRAVAGQDREAAEQAGAFGAICLGFLAGAAAGAPLTLLLGDAATWPVAALLAIGLGLFLYDERRSR
ncbi:YoaK family protein [Sciscionella marina]|uniref:YoaK family protein n=1 Tax=Sciscionella marina TaxID=508770 RepID=UPI000369E180|nr:YoaK family protein [Sciscionella marina]